jgi:predicted peptidase
MFMHGTGGGSLLSNTKKALRSNGIEYVAARFVIVSPKCTWTWKQPAEPWVAELARQLRACSWVDPERIYLTGCSMGGMGTWEVAALVPDVFAAIAPVAGHHKADNNARLVEKLREMPIFAVHSTDDPTCPFQPEEELWQALRAGGNTRLQVCCAQSINHCEVFDRAYCDSPVIFEWLLKHRRFLPKPTMATVDEAAAKDTPTIEC